MQGRPLKIFQGQAPFISSPLSDDFFCDLVIENLFREIKDPKHPLHTYYHR